MKFNELDRYPNKKEKLSDVIAKKIDQFVEKRGSLHTTAAKLTPAEKDNLEKEVDRLEFEIKKLQDFVDIGVEFYDDHIKQETEWYVDDMMAKKHVEKKDRYSLIKQIEKQYGMPIAQIRQKYRGIPLDKLVKKESVYKKLLRHLFG
jgi:DNA repair ATPase RecN